MSYTPQLYIPFPKKVYGRTRLPKEWHYFDKNGLIIEMKWGLALQLILLVPSNQIQSNELQVQYIMFSRKMDIPC